ncbi:MAG: InlB B-repeat-containing protein [Clostridia bacterium]|nr:InlB B-repeat-containing protein [Clostridia bacterium]
MKKKFSLILLALLLVLVLATGLIACDPTDDTPEPPITDGDGNTNDDSPQGPTMWTVTIDLQDGSEPTTQQVEDGKTAVYPEIASTSYKQFKGWSTTADGTSFWNKTTPITGELTIYACWASITAKVTFNFNYKGAPKQVSEQHPLGEPLVLPEIPTRDYWIFDAWYLDAETTREYDTSAILTGTIKLYAGWKLDPAHTCDFETETILPTCTTDGYDRHTCVCGTTYDDNVIPMTNHSVTFSDTDYFGMVYCNNTGCDVAQRKDSLRIYDDVFDYTFNSTKEKEIDDRYQSMLDILESVERYDQAIHAYDKESALYEENKAFEEIFNAFYDDLMYLIEQYQYAYVFYCVDDNSVNTAAYEKITEYRTDAVSDFYALYRLIYESKFREFFFDKVEGGWTDEDIQMALKMSDSYGGAEYAALNKRISEIEVEFRDIDDPSTGTATPKLYGEFVELNNKIAKLAGYDNYIEYAYENVYNREYSPEDTAVMRNYVKTYLKDTYATIYEGYRASSSGFISDAEAKTIFDAISYGSIFDSKVESKIITDMVKAYFEKMNSAAGVAGNQAIDFYHHANELFKNGNYYTGTYEGAYSYWIGAQDTSILYFGPGSYSGAFTFVHEFGHYYNNVYNPDISFSYDLDETHSQGNEMMFLAFLKDSYLSDVAIEQIYNRIYFDNLFNFFNTILMSTAVDEFEYCVYNGIDLDGNPKEYGVRDYDKLFREIMKEYGIDEHLVDYYWRFVVIEAPCYYISYAMSALPCIELLTVAETQGFEAAQAKYFKFFTFTDDPNNVETDEMGDKVVKIGYADTLKYVGLHSIFDEELYSTIKACFVKEESENV